MSQTSRLLGRVQRRQFIARFLHVVNLLMLGLCGLYALLLLVVRLTGLLPDRLTPVTLGAPFVLAAVGALLWLRTPRPERTAHLIDSRTAGKDLFLTAVLIDRSMGSYQPLVTERAEEAAASVRPEEVLPLPWTRPARNALFAAALLAMGIFYLPQLDPFGREEGRQAAEELKRELDEGRKTVAARKEALSRKDIEAELSRNVEQRMEDLRATLNQMKPAERDPNLAKLNEEQRKLGEMWRQASEKKLRDALERNPAAQQFGALSPKQEEWKRELAQGRTDALKREMADLKGLAAALSEAKDGPEKERLKRELTERARELSRFMSRDANNAPANTAMQQAMEQLAMLNAPGLDADALKAFQESLGLTELELSSLAQNVRDLQALEEAMKAAQLAKQLNAQGKLEGGEMGEGAGLGDYAAFYAMMLAQMGGQGQGGQGMGMGGPGQGRGGVAPEDASLKSDFQSERSRSALTAGKILMEWKTKEMGPKGEAHARYLESMAEVKQGADEAILQEQVPPGYHEAISKYFDTIEVKNAGEPAAP